MLEIRYNKTTRELTGWCGDSKQFGLMKAKDNEAITTIDSGVPPKPLKAYLYDNGGKILKANPQYAEPEPQRNLIAEIDDLKSRVKSLEAG